jgi:DNA adenine methylase
MNTPITYYGGKQSLAARIIEMLPKHHIYCEPFFGGGAVFFRKEKSPIEVVNDKNNLLITFYLSIQKSFPKLQALVNNTLHSETIYRYAKDIYNNRVVASRLEKAWAFWLLTNGSFSGSIYGGWKWDNGISRSHVGIYLKNKRAHFSEILQKRLETTQISCRDALKVIKERDSAETFFYLDPPYPGAEQQHYRNYTHKDFFHLLQLLSTIQGKFILSNYWSQTLKYHIIRYGWKYRSIAVNLKVASLGHSSPKTRTEYLVYNYDEENTLFNFNSN